MILVDSSAWIEFDRETNSTLDRAVTRLIRSGGAEIAVTEPILMEVLAGARDARRELDLRRLLTSFSWLPADAVADFAGAARIYRECRSRAVTPRGLVDCIIANVAIRTGAEILAADRDFVAIAKVVPIRLHRTSRR